MKRSPLKRGKKRLKPVGRRGKRMRESGEVFGALGDFVIEGRKYGGHCDSCGEWTDTLRRDHVSKKKPRTAWKNGKGNLWVICHGCDTIKENKGQRRLDLLFPHRPTGKEIAERLGERFKKTREGTEE